MFNLNKLKKCLSVGLIIAIVLSMTGCGLLNKIKSDPVTKEELVSNALECVQNADSMDIVNVVTAIEAKYKIIFPIDDKVKRDGYTLQYLMDGVITVLRNK